MIGKKDIRSLYRHMKNVIYLLDNFIILIILILFFNSSPNAIFSLIMRLFIVVKLLLIS